MTGQLWAVIGLLVTNAGFLFGMWRYFEGRVSKIYGRLDTVKESMAATYVRKDNCSLLHASTSDNLRSVETRIDTRFDKLENKVEKAFAMIMELLKK